MKALKCDHVSYKLEYDVLRGVKISSLPDVVKKVIDIIDSTVVSYHAGAPLGLGPAISGPEYLHVSDVYTASEGYGICQQYEQLKKEPSNCKWAFQSFMNSDHMQFLAATDNIRQLMSGWTQYVFRPRLPLKFINVEYLKAIDKSLALAEESLDNLKACNADPDFIKNAELVLKNRKAYIAEKLPKPNETNTIQLVGITAYYFTDYSPDDARDFYIKETRPQGDPDIMGFYPQQSTKDLAQLSPRSAKDVIDPLKSLAKRVRGEEGEKWVEALKWDLTIIRQY